MVTSISGGCMVDIVTVASGKGGSGKTTACVNIAVQATKSGKKVALIDTDPQGSLSDWYEQRKIPGPDLVKSTPITSESDLKKLQEQGQHDLVIIDTPGHLAFRNNLQKIIAISSLIIIPVRPSPLDLRTIGETLDLIGDRKPFVFLLNSADLRTHIALETALALSNYGPVLKTPMANRVLYAESMTDGRTPMEVDPKSKASVEIENVWKNIRKFLQKVGTG